jgi:ZU5 domain
MRASLRRISLVAASLALFSACSSEPTSAPQARIPAPAAPNADLLGGLLGGAVNLVQNLVLPGLLRTSPLAADITVSQTIGAAGGTLSIPAAGVTVVVPAGALSSNTLITMTARKGSLVAYDFAPHGITFAKPLVFTQSLTGTNATLLSVPFLKLGYYSDPSLLTAVGGLVSELLGGTTSLLSWTFTANIKHFSGYMIGTARGGSTDSGM